MQKMRRCVLELFVAISALAVLTAVGAMWLSVVHSLFGTLNLPDQ